MGWSSQFMDIAEASLQIADLRYRLAFCDNARGFKEQPGLARLPESIVVLSVYESLFAVARAEAGLDVKHECRYPGGRMGKNPKRADLAVKERGRGRNWCYIEVKKYGGDGKASILADIDKLWSISKRSQRWVFVYRIRKDGGRAKSLGDVMRGSLGDQLWIEEERSFSTLNWDGEGGVCDLVLARV